MCVVWCGSGGGLEFVGCIVKVFVVFVGYFVGLGGICDVCG